MSETGKQYTIISENFDKKDFSTLYNHLQDALSKRFDQDTELNDETTTFFNKIMRSIYNDNINKTFPQNTVITKANAADTTINIISKCKESLQSKEQFQVINSLDYYDDIICKIRDDESHCAGVCVGYCTTTCGGKCFQTCIGGEMPTSIYQGQGTTGCSSGCSSVCSQQCGANCTGTCARQNTITSGPPLGYK